ncbi:hypothetical protein HYS28_01440 [Candidatus Uhrbacteria bacterium]|nr:hypothetical protein [Candidatus Uhrbacteria bacterium]
MRALRTLLLAVAVAPIVGVWAFPLGGLLAVAIYAVLLGIGRAEDAAWCLLGFPCAGLALVGLSRSHEERWLAAIPMPSPDDTPFAA